MTETWMLTTPHTIPAQLAENVAAGNLDVIARTVARMRADGTIVLAHETIEALTLALQAHIDTSDLLLEGRRTGEEMGQIAEELADLVDLLDEHVALSTVGDTTVGQLLSVIINAAAQMRTTGAIITIIRH